MTIGDESVVDCELGKCNLLVTVQEDGSVLERFEVVQGIEGGFAAGSVVFSVVKVDMDELKMTSTMTVDDQKFELEYTRLV